MLTLFNIYNYGFTYIFRIFTCLSIYVVFFYIYIHAKKYIYVFLQSIYNYNCLSFAICVYIQSCYPSTICPEPFAASSSWLAVQLHICPRRSPSACCNVASGVPCTGLPPWSPMRSKRKNTTGVEALCGS